MSAINAVAYARYSSDRQQESSITVQLADIRKFCASHQIHLIREYVDEAQTGTNANRKNFQQMVQDVKEREFQLIIVHRLDRWARSVDDGRYYKKYFKKYGAKIVSAIEGFNETPEGEFYELMSMGMAELYSKKLARECAAGKVANALEGKAHGGTPLLGYTVKGKRYVIDEQEAEAVKIIFRMASEGYGYTYIRDYLNKIGYRHSDGRLFTAHFYDILRNRKYIGEYVYNRTVSKDENGYRNNHRNRAEHDIIRLQGAIPQIVDRETFEKVQALLDSRKANKIYTPIRRERKFLLSGLLRCAECGRAICGSSAAKDGIRYPVYRCGAKGRTCPTRMINSHYLDDYVHTLLTGCLFKPENANRLEQFIQDCYVRAYNALRDKWNASRETVGVIQEKIAELERELSGEQASPLQQLIEAQIDTLQANLHKTEYKQELMEKEIAAFPDYNPLRIRKNVKKYFERLSDRSFDNLQRCFRELVRIIKIDNDHIKITFAFNVLMDAYTPITGTVIETRDYIARPENFYRQTFAFSKLTIQTE